MLPSFASVVETSLRASVFILSLVVGRPVLRRWVGSRAVALLWLVPAAGLLVPPAVRVPWRLPSLPLPARVQTLARPWTFRVSVSPAARLGQPPATSPATFLASLTPAPRAGAWSALWLVGALLGLARLVPGRWLTHRWSARTLPADTDPRLPPLYLALPAPLRRNVTLRLTDDLDAPALVGLLRPQVWLPRSLPAVLSDAELRHVLLHELGHARRRDLLAQWLCSLACCLHWFNPLVWLLARLARTDRELACDAWVLARVPSNDRSADFPSAYGHTLLKVVDRLRTPSLRVGPALVSMAAGRRCLGLRVREIGAFRPVPAWRGGVALALLSLLVVAFPAGRAADDPAPLPAPVSTAAPVTPPPAPAAPPTEVTISPSAAGPVGDDAFAGLSSQVTQIMVAPKIIEVPRSALEKMKAASVGTPSSAFLEELRTNVALQAKDDAAKPPVLVQPLPSLTDAELQSFVHVLNQAGDADVLSAPRVTTRSGQKVTIEIIHETPFPVAFVANPDPSGQPAAFPVKFETRHLGFTLEVTPVLAPGSDRIALEFFWQIVSVAGFVHEDGTPIRPGEPPDPRRQPMITTRSVKSTVSLPPGSTLAIAMPGPNPGVQQAVDYDELVERNPPDPTAAKDAFTLGLVTATLVLPTGVLDKTGHPAHPAASSGPGQPAGDVPSPWPSLEPPVGPARATPTYEGFDEEKVGTPAAGSPAPPSTDKLPYGFAVPGKPGFITSPYAPDAGYIDVHGFRRGQQVHDPYTGKQLLIP